MAIFVTALALLWEASAWLSWRESRALMVGISQAVAALSLPDSGGQLNVWVRRDPQVIRLARCNLITATNDAFHSGYWRCVIPGTAIRVAGNQELETGAVDTLRRNWLAGCKRWLRAPGAMPGILWSRSTFPTGGEVSEATAFKSCKSTDDK